MEALRYITNAITLFFKNWNIGTKENIENIETTTSPFGINLKKDTGKAPISLLGQLYSEENETLFI